eukprot:4826560-Pyramimonas_sp.AAC.1
MVSGQQEDSVTYRIAIFAAQFGPLGKELRPQAARELFEFSRRHNETTDALLSRLHALRIRDTRN